MRWSCLFRLFLCCFCVSPLFSCTSQQFHCICKCCMISTHFICISINFLNLYSSPPTHAPNTQRILNADAVMAKREREKHLALLFAAKQNENVKDNKMPLCFCYYSSSSFFTLTSTVVKLATIERNVNRVVASNFSNGNMFVCSPGRITLQLADGA